MKRFFLTFLFALAAATLFAQQLPKQVSVKRPSVLDRDIVKESAVPAVLREPYGQDSQGRSGTGSFWDVFSDRDDNPVYDAPGSKNVIKTLEIGDKLRIAQISKDYALVFTDYANDYPNISKTAEYVGWVPLGRLLLWQKVLSDDIGISRKAVICVDLDQKGKLKDVERRKRYRSPSGSKGIYLSSDMHFFYVLKRDSGRVLLGKSAEINSVSDIFGWVDESSFVPWNSRTCLEPTWEKEDVEYFSSKRIQWQVFNNAEMKGPAPAGDVFNTANRRVGKDDRFAEKYKYRNMPVTYLRYPILDGGTDKVYHCTTFGTLDGSKGSSKAGAANVDEDHAKALRRLNDMKKVNIVITIDGTKSMGQYFDAVKDALNEIDKYFDTKVNVGVMVYRDKEDGDKVTECFPSVGFTQPNNPNLHKWIDEIIKNRLNSKAKDLRESLFYGINKAIDQFFPEGKGLENQSNIMLVIGDCGDNGKFEISRKTLVDKIAARNITMMGFQVVNKSKDDYTIFNQQMKYLMRYSIQKRYSQASKLPLDINPKERDGGKVVEMAIADPKFKDNFFIGLHCSNPDKDKPMQKEYLTASIEKVLGEWKASVDYLNRIVGNYSDYGEQETLAEEDIEGTQLRNDVIRYMLGDDALFERLKEQRELLSFRGWAKKQQDRRDLFKVIVFFPARELEGLLRTLQNVYMVAKKEADNKQSKPDRRPYYEAMMKLARTVMAQKDISSTSYNKILAKVFGLVDYQDSYSLEDIIDPNIVSDNQFRDIVNKMYDKVRQLQNVTAGDYPFLLTYSGNNDMYYWLPSEYLPLI